MSSAADVLLDELIEDRPVGEVQSDRGVVHRHRRVPGLREGPAVADQLGEGVDRCSDPGPLEGALVVVHGNAGEVEWHPVEVPPGVEHPGDLRREGRLVELREPAFIAGHERIGLAQDRKSVV